MPNENLVVWTTDWHLVSNNSETSSTGQPTTPAKAQDVVAYINGTLDPVGCFDTGDNKDHYGAVGTEDEHDNYINYVGNELNWLTVNAGDTNALYPNLPGNHDEFYDSDVTGTGNNDFSTTYDVKFWPSPYHWTCDWDAARIRFIGAHSYIHHDGTATGPVDAGGLAHITSNELAWIENEINTLPERWQSIICTHYPVNEIFGNNIKYVDDDYQYALSPFNDLMRDRSTKVLCHLSGHRHQNFWYLVQDGVHHITSGGVSYGAGNGYGTFCPISYEPDDRTITIDCRYAVAPYARFTGFTPLTFQLQPHRLFFART